MTTTGPQTAGPARKCPWYRLPLVWNEAVAILLIVLWLSDPMRWPIRSERHRCYAALLAGLFTAFLVRQHRRPQVVPHGSTSPWYHDGIVGVLLLLMGIDFSHDLAGELSYSCVGVFAIAALFLASMARKFFTARQQFTLRTLMLVTLGVAILCSVSFYVPIVPLLIFLAIPALEWARFGPPSLGHDNVGPKHLKSEISDPESQISDPKPEIQNPKSKI